MGGSPRNLPAWFLFDRQGVEKYSILTQKLELPTTGTADTRGKRALLLDLLP